MRTTIVILIGLAALAAFTVLGPVVAPGASRAAAASVFVGVWLAFCVIDWYIGVYHAGYSAMEELRIHAAIFAIPAVAALVIVVLGHRAHR
jgi:hypothetical protein